MKKIIIGFVGLMVILLPSEIAFAFGRGGSYSGSRGNFSSSNRAGGSTSHSYGSTSHSNAYGGSSSHTAGQGTTHDSGTAPVLRTMKEEERLTRTPMAVKHLANTGKVQRTRMPTAAKRRVNMGKVRPTPTPTAGPRLAPMGRAQRIRTFTVVPRLAPTARVRITPVRMATAPRIIHQPPTMAIIHRPR